MYLGGTGSDKKYAGQVGTEIDQEVRRMIDEAYKTAYGIISKNKPLMNLFAEALLIKETLTSEEAEFIFENKKLPEQVEAMKVKKTSKAKKATTETAKKPAAKSTAKASTTKSTSKTKEEDKTK